jgi:hypothetical protein
LLAIAAIVLGVLGALLALLVVSWQFSSICRELAGTLHDLANVAERLWPAETGGPADTTIASTERA